MIGARLSALARCPRQAAYTALGSASNEPSDQMHRYLARGRVFEEYVAAQFEAKYPGQIQSQREITWKLGTGHADIYVTGKRLLVEVVSTVAPTGKILDFKIEQVKLYLRHDAEAEKAAVYVVNPSDLRREELLPVRLTDEDRERIDATIAEVAAAVESNGESMPACCASSPDECRFSHMCSYTDLAWADWEPPPPAVMPEEGRVLLARLAALEQSCRGAQSLVDAAKFERDEVRDLLAPFVEPGVEYEHEGVTVKVSQVKGRETVRLAAARTAGAITPGIEEALAPWTAVGEPSLRWTVKVAEGALVGVAEDYGDVPF